MSEDIRTMRLAVTMCRDPNWYGTSNLSRLVEYALLYAGASSSDVLTLPIHDLSNPLFLFQVLNYLNLRGALADFLTQILRDYRPIGTQSVTFIEHLQPLGLDWDRASNQIRPTATHPEAEGSLRTELDNLLAGVDGAFPNMLHGAWEAYYSDNPDRFRQSITSCRELLAQVTDSLGQGGTRRERIQRIIGSNSTTEVVDAAANLVNSIYSAQSAGTHANIGSATVLFVLVETEHILYFLLKQRAAV